MFALAQKYIKANLDKWILFPPSCAEDREVTMAVMVCTASSVMVAPIINQSHAVFPLYQICSPSLEQ